MSRWGEIVLDCADPETLASFWCAVLDWRVVSSSPDVIELFPRRIDDADRLVEIRAGAVVPSLALVRTPGRKIVKNRVHLDVTPIDRSHDAEVERLLALGATRVDGGQSGEES